MKHWHSVSTFRYCYCSEKIKKKINLRLRNLQYHLVDIFIKAISQGFNIIFVIFSNLKVQPNGQNIVNFI